MASVAVIGAGFSGLSAAAYLSSAGHDVQVFEKNTTAGGQSAAAKDGSGVCVRYGTQLVLDARCI